MQLRERHCHQRIHTYAACLSSSGVHVTDCAKQVRWQNNAHIDECPNTANLYLSIRAP